MSAWAAIQFEQEPVELAEFARYLRLIGFPHRISEQQGILTLWVFDQTHIIWVQQKYQKLLDGELQMPIAPRKTQPSAFPALIQQTPVTFILILLSIVGFLAVWSTNLNLISWLSFQGFDPQSLTAAGSLTMNSHQQWLELMAQGQWWRLFSPMFLHFGWLHLAFNMVLFWYLGQQVERHQGSLRFLSWVLIMSLVSNCAQYLASAHLFGGMSGVDYGLIAYCSIRYFKDPSVPYLFPRGLFWFSVVSMVLGFLGLFSLLGIQIANWAHLAGFVAGLGLALLPVGVQKPRNS